LEQLRDLLRRHADAGVAHLEDHRILTVQLLPGRHERDRAGFGELARVAQEIEERLAHLREVRSHRADRLGARHVEAVCVLRGVRSSCDMFARNSDLCRSAISSWRLLSSISRNSRAFWMASADWLANVLRSSMTAGGNSPGVFLLTVSPPIR